MTGALIAFLIRDMPVEMLRWLVAVVVLYTAVVMLRSALTGWKPEHAAAPPTAVAG